MTGALSLSNQSAFQLASRLEPGDAGLQTPAAYNAYYSNQFHRMVLSPVWILYKLILEPKLSYNYNLYIFKK